MSMTLEQDRLVSFLASMPGLAHSTVERADLRNILLNTEGELMVNGKLWDITSKKLGAGVYRISTTRRTR